MKGGNGATIGSGITQFAEGEQNAGMCVYQTDAAENLSGSRTSVRNRKPHAKSAKFAKLLIGERFAAEASKNLLNAESPSDPLDRGCLSRRRNNSRGAAEVRRMFAKF